MGLAAAPGARWRTVAVCGHSTCPARWRSRSQRAQAAAAPSVRASMTDSGKGDSQPPHAPFTAAAIDGHAARRGQRLVGPRDGGRQTSEQGLSAAPEIVHLGVERYPPHLGLPQRGLELQHQLRRALFLSRGRGRPGPLAAVVVPRRFTRRQGAAPLELARSSRRSPGEERRGAERAPSTRRRAPRNKLVDPGEVRE